MRKIARTKEAKGVDLSMAEADNSQEGGLARRFLDLDSSDSSAFH